MVGLCPKPRIPFPEKPCSRLRIDNPYSYAQLPLIAWALGARLYWEGPRLRVRGLDGSWVEVEGSGEALEVGVCIEPGSPCVWIPPGPSPEAYVRLASLLGVSSEQELLANYSPLQYTGVLVGETPSTGIVVESGEGLVYAYLQLPGGSSTSLEGTPHGEVQSSSVAAGSYRYGVEGGFLKASRGVAWAALEVGAASLCQASGIGRAEVGGGDAFLTPTGVYLKGVDQLVLRHGMYGGRYLWVQPFAIVSSSAKSLDLQSWWVCIEGSYAVCVASDRGLEVRAKPGYMEVAGRGEWIWVGLSNTPNHGATGVLRASRSLAWPPARVRGGSRPGTPLWRVTPEHLLVYDAVVEGDAVYLALLGLSKIERVELRVAGRIVEASLWDASLSTGEQLYPEYDLLIFGLGQGLEIVSLKVRRSPFIGLRVNSGG